MSDHAPSYLARFGEGPEILIGGRADWRQKDGGAGSGSPEGGGAAGGAAGGTACAAVRGARRAAPRASRAGGGTTPRPALLLA